MGGSGWGLGVRGPRCVWLGQGFLAADLTWSVHSSELGCPHRYTKGIHLLEVVLETYR